MFAKRALLCIVVGLTTVSTAFAQAHTTALGNERVGRGSSSIFNVTDFGVCGNGEDATPAINAAIIAARDATPSGGTIYFPKGLYVVTSTIWIGDGITSNPWSRNIGHYISIQGEGIGVSTIYAMTNGDDVFSSLAETPGVVALAVKTLMITFPPSIKYLIC